MPKVLCRCEDCLTEFVEDGSMLSLPAGMNPISKKPNRTYLVSWPEWIFHVAHHCKKCRYSTPPKACLEDLHRAMDVRRNNLVDSIQFDQEINRTDS